MSKGQVTGIEDFDWGGLGKHDEAYTAEQKIELEAAYGITVNAISAHEVIEGSIVVKTKREVVVNIGYKSEGVISISEFRYDPELKEGDKKLPPKKIKKTSSAAKKKKRTSSHAIISNLTTITTQCAVGTSNFSLRNVSSPHVQNPNMYSMLKM